MYPLFNKAGRWQWLLRIQFGVLLAVYLYLGATRISAEVAATFNDLVAHGLGYAVAAISAYLAFAWGRSFLLSLLFLWVFSVFVELVQFYLPYRSFSLMDIAANTTGLLAGTLLVSFWRWMAAAISARFFSVKPAS